MKVIICAGGPSPAIEQLTQSEEQTVYIGVDRGALRLIRQGLALDVALGDFDSVTKAELQQIEQHSQQLLKFPSEKDETDLELALLYIIKHYREAEEIIVYGSLTGKGRIDHFVANLWLAHDQRFRSIIEKMLFIEREHQMRYLLPGQHELINTLNYQYLSIISLTPINGLTIIGAKYELTTKKDFAPVALISNEFVPNQPKVQVAFDEGIASVWYVQTDK